MLERGAEFREDEDWLAAAAERADARLLVAAGSRQLITTDGTRAARPARAAAPELVQDAYQVVFLGLEDGAPCFLALHDHEPRTTHGDFVELRSVFGSLHDADFALLLYARALALWHASHRHCGHCGAATRGFRAGHARTCTACSREVFPRLDPAIIVLVADAERCLLGRGTQWPEGRFSTLAGFVEPGETVEQAVLREVAEESGVTVTDPRYIASQPWPFPASLMLGFEARPAGGNLHTGDGELAEVRWFTRDDIRQGLADGSLTLSDPRSIAHRLIADWFRRGGDELPSARVAR